ncbi:hypothetical protein [Phenylobacterium sp.]|uniref:hypothetical protein n=1 Tax=Phenylobacterium sp. TaxID=1871053 RepID=UPI0025FE33AE|nr:hypothetical protein [Phenylobacterium sp.]MCA3715377.1 hypothetical protein [Phenylobacterium sp.]
MTQLYQRRRLSTGEDIGAPAPLPAFLVGWPDHALADVAGTAPQWAAQMGQEDLGFFPFTPPAPPPPEPPPGLERIDFLRLFTTSEQLAILQAAAINPMVALYQYKLSISPRVLLDDPDILAGVPLLEANELIGPGRAAQILAGQAP